MDLDLTRTGMGIAPDLAYILAMTRGEQCATEEGECESGKIVERRRREHRLTPEKDDDASTRLYWRSLRKGLGSQQSYVSQIFLNRQTSVRMSSSRATS
ncbi:hypothetical protein [Burkholderia sp. BCC1977]|uniref:hypothetical protein n=1 Tax=Burkholderia sp. BCC1977 TaxID=2817440 RepID=UPI002ABDFBC0|nr:hypothetical protein [Burkholderia sp. BCC1977]